MQLCLGLILKIEGSTAKQKGTSANAVVPTLISHPDYIQGRWKVVEAAGAYIELFSDYKTI